MKLFIHSSLLSEISHISKFDFSVNINIFVTQHETIFIMTLVESILLAVIV